jgi:hypothetical protein
LLQGVIEHVARSPAEKETCNRDLHVLDERIEARVRELYGINPKEAAVIEAKVQAAEAQGKRRKGAVSGD